MDIDIEMTGNCSVLTYMSYVSEDRITAIDIDQHVIGIILSCGTHKQWQHLVPYVRLLGPVWYCTVHLCYSQWQPMYPMSARA